MPNPSAIGRVIIPGAVATAILCVPEQIADSRAERERAHAHANSSDRAQRRPKTRPNPGTRTIVVPEF